MHLGNELIESFGGDFKAKSFSIGKPALECTEGSVFELYAYQDNDWYRDVPSTNYTLIALNTNTTELLKGAVDEADAFHYVWDCVKIEDACMTLSLDRDPSIPRHRDYAVDILISVDDVIYRDVSESWHEHQNNTQVNHVDYSLIGTACGIQDCDADEVLFELQLDTRREKASALKTNYGIDLYQDGGENYETDVVHDSDVFGLDSLIARTRYRYLQCFPAYNCYIFNIVGFYSNAYGETPIGEANSTVQVQVDGKTLYTQRIPLVDDSEYYNGYGRIKLTGPCGSDDKVSSGRLVAVLIGSVLGFVAILVLVYRCFYKRTPNQFEEESNHSVEPRTLSANGLSSVDTCDNDDVDADDEKTENSNSI